MLTVDHDGDSVESDLLGGVLECPGCGGRLRPWSWARPRRIRHGVGTDFRVVVHRPRRARCVGCKVTQVLLPVGLAGRRADEAAVIAVAIEAKAVNGFGYRRVAALVGRPPSTVRGWLRAVAAAAPAMVGTFTALVLRDAGDAAGLWPAPAPAGIGAVVGIVAAYAHVIAERRGVDMVTWQVAGLAAVGPWFFCAPWWRKTINTS